MTTTTVPASELRPGMTARPDSWTDVPHRRVTAVERKRDRLLGDRLIVTLKGATITTPPGWPWSVVPSGTNPQPRPDVQPRPQVEGSLVGSDYDLAESDRVIARDVSGPPEGGPSSRQAALF